MVEMAFGELARLVCHGLIDGGGPSWVTQGPKGCGASGEATVQAVCLKEIDKFARVFNKAWLNVIPSPRGVMPVKVPRQYQRCGSI
jgi:hypothetical protein